MVKGLGGEGEGKDKSEGEVRVSMGMSKFTSHTRRLVFAMST